MATQIQWRRGNTAQTATFTGAVAEITVDTDKKTIVVHDGTTAGGIPLAKESTISSIYNHANGAFDKANSSNVIAQAAFDKANQTAQLAFTTVSANGTSLTADANNDTLTITSAVANGVFVSANASTDALDIGLIDSGVTASGYGDSVSVPTFVVDTKGRLTSASNTSIRSGTTTQTGIVQLQDSVISTSTSNAATPASVKTAYDLANTANINAVNAGTYANAAFDKANSANVLAQSGYNQANTATTTAGLAYTHANGAFDKANTATTTAGLAYNHANGAFDKANTATTTADAAFAKANSANVIAQAAFDNSNTKFSSSGGTISGDTTVTGNLIINGTTTTVNTSTVSTTDSLLKLANNNTAGDSLDIGFYGTYNATGQKYAGLVRQAGSNFFLFKDLTTDPTANALAVGSLTASNTATLRANITGGTISSLASAIAVADGGTGATTLTAGGILIGSGTSAVTILANTGTAGTYANAAYVPVITTDTYGRVSAVTNTAIAIDTAAITSGTLAVARGGTGVTTSTGTGAVVLNTAPTLSNVSVTGLITVSDNVRANYVVANTAFTSAAGASKLELSDIGLVGISVAGQTYQFGASGLESNQGIFGGTFGGNRLSLNNETNLISNRYDTVKIQTGTDGTTVNEFVFANNSFSVPGTLTTVTANITSTTTSTSNTTGALKVAGGVGIKGNVYADAIYDGGIEVISFANQAFTQANSANVLAQAAFDKANTDTTSISATAGVYGNASIVPVFTLAANGRVSAVTNTAIAIDTSAITSGTIADARLPTKVSVGTFGNSTTAITLTVDAQGRITAISQSAITLTESDPTALAFAIALG
jgi:hypothetical protein